jgi:hypothetical protein
MDSAAAQVARQHGLAVVVHSPNPRQERRYDYQFHSCAKGLRCSLFQEDGYTVGMIVFLVVGVTAVCGIFYYLLYILTPSKYLE